MKRIQLILMIVLLLGFSQISNAALIPMNLGPNGDLVVYDEGTGLYWVGDMARYTNQDFAAQQASIAADNYGGITTWQMADLAQAQTVHYTGQAIMAAFEATSSWLTGSGMQYNYNGRTSTPPSPSYPGTHPDYHISTSELGGTSWGTYYVQPDADVSSSIGAWAYTTAVPEPASLLLIGSGLVGLLCITRKKQS